MQPPMIRDEGGILRLTLDDPGAKNEGQAFAIRRSLYGAVESRDVPRVIVDLGAIDYITSTGIALLIGIKRRVESRGGKVVLCRLRDEVHELFRIMKLVQLFEIVAGEAEAIELLLPISPE